MLQKLKKLFTQYSKPDINPEVFEHPLALKTKWTPQKNGGSNFRTRKLVEKDRNRLVFKPSTMYCVFLGLFLVFPVIFAVIFPRTSHLTGSDSFMFLLVPGLIFIVTLIMLYFGVRPIVFDKKLKYFYKSYKKPVSLRNVKSKKNWIPLSDIKALQIIGERVKTKNSTYTSYELNIVNAQGGRYNIVDHSSYKNLNKEAIQLADFLGIPYWDAIAPNTYTPKNRRQEIQIEYGDVEDIIEEVDVIDNQDTDKPYNSLKRRKM